MSREIDRGKRHDLTAVDEGLCYLALCYGKARKASRAMAADGLTPVPAATLDYWKKVSHPKRYEQLRQEVEKRRDLDAAERMDALVSKALDIEEKVLKQTDENLDKIAPRDLPNAFKNLAIGGGVLQDKSDRIKRRPAEVAEHRIDVAKLEKALADLERIGRERLAQQQRIIDAEVVEAETEAHDGRESIA